MTNTITISIEPELVKKLDTLRQSSNISRSKLISNILNYVCNNKQLTQEVFKKYES